MAVVDLIFAIALILVVIVLASIVARQRQMLRSAGAIPLATRRGSRWLYGVGRYCGQRIAVVPGYRHRHAAVANHPAR